MATHRRLGDGTILGTVPTGDNPRSIAFDGKNTWIDNWYPDGRVMRLKARDGMFQGSLLEGTNPGDVLFDGTASGLPATEVVRSVK